LQLFNGCPFANRKFRKDSVDPGLAVCVVQTKPILEKLLGLAPGILTKVTNCCMIRKCPYNNGRELAL